MAVVCDTDCWSKHYEYECKAKTVAVPDLSGCRSKTTDGDYVSRPERIRPDIDQEGMKLSFKPQLKNNWNEKRTPCADVDNIEEMTSTVYILDSGASADTFDESEARETLGSIVRQLTKPMKSSTANGTASITYGMTAKIAKWDATSNYLLMNAPNLLSMGQRVMFR